MTNHYDLIIVGGGIGGGALATVMARSGYSVLVLEKSTVYRDLVRGEWMAPWGVVEAKRLGLFDDLIEEGAHHLSRHVTYGETIDPKDAEANMLPIAVLVPDVPGPLCIGHPAHCDLRRRSSAAAGATALSGVTRIKATLGAHPSVSYTHEGGEHSASCKIIVGADGRGSLVRQAAGIEPHRDPNHHLFSGMLIENAHGWPDDLQAIGAEKDVHFLAFPQANGRVRLYLGYSSDQPRRLAGARRSKPFSTRSGSAVCRSPARSPARRRRARATHTPTKTHGRTSRSPKAWCSSATPPAGTIRSSDRDCRSPTAT